MSNIEQQLKEQLKFESFVSSFYIDLVVNHGLVNDGYFTFILKLISEIKQNSTDINTLNTELKNLPGVVYEKMTNGELNDLLK